MKSTAAGPPLMSQTVLSQFEGESGLITGVVRVSEISRDRHQTILEILVGTEEPLTILVKGGADVLLGHAVIIRPASPVIYGAAFLPYGFQIKASLGGPVAIVGRHAPLYLPLSKDALDKVRADIEHGQLSEKQHFVRRKYQRQGLSENWKLAELLMIIPLIADKDRDRAVHMAAVMIIEQAERFGNCSGAATLFTLLRPSQREKISNWFWKHSPIRVDLSRKRRKVYISRTSEGAHRPYLTDIARHTPI